MNNRILAACIIGIAIILLLTGGIIYLLWERNAPEREIRAGGTLQETILPEQEITVDEELVSEEPPADEAEAETETETETETEAKAEPEDDGQRAEELRMRRAAEAERRRAEQEQLARASRELREQMEAVNELIAQGVAMLERGYLSGAGRVFAEARSIMPRGENRFEAQKLADMAEAWYDVFARSPNSPEGREAARIAEVLAGESIVLDRTQARPHFTIGKIGRDLRDWDKASASFAEAARLDPSNFLYPFELGRSHFNARRLAEAQRAFENTVNLNSGFDQGWHNLGAALAAQNRHDQALTAFRRAVSIRSDYWQAHRDIGRILISRRDYRSATESFTNAIRNNPNDLSLLRELGMAQSQSGSLVAAEASFARILEAQPDDAQINYNMAVVQLGLGKNNEALLFARRALNSNPSNAVYAYTVGLAHEALRDVDSAIGAYRNAASLDPRYVRPRINLGRIFLEQNNFDDALKYLYDEAFRIEPANFEVNNNLGAVFAKMENWGFSVEHYERAIRVENNHPTVHLNLARAYSGAGDLARARNSYLNVLRLVPDNWDAMFELAKTYIGLELPGDAGEYLSELVRRNPAFHGRAEAERLLAGL